jgi:predicted RNase H-like nuclease (RuvC/YqgF family)
MTTTIVASIDKSMDDHDRVKEAYYAIQNVLEVYKCEFELSVTKTSSGDENWNIMVKSKKEKADG